MLCKWYVLCHIQGVFLQFFISRINKLYKYLAVIRLESLGLEGSRVKLKGKVNQLVIAGFDPGNE